jgi:hypothetical protein
MKSKLLLVLLFSAIISSRAEFVGIPNDEFESHYRAQKEPMWCWASSAEMVLSYEGVELEQEAIVTKVKGVPINQGGNPQEIDRAVNGVFRDTNDDQVVVSGQFVTGAPSTTVVYNQLKRKHPIILTYQPNAYSGHAVVLTGIDAEVTDTGVTIQHIYIFDPFSYHQVTQPVQVMGQFGPTVIDQPVFTTMIVPGPFGPMPVQQPVLESDPTLIHKQYSIASTYWNQVVLPGVGTITGMVLVDGTK